MILQTQRLILREFELSDAENLYLLNSDPDVLQFTGDVAFLNVADAENFIRVYSDYKRNGYGRWAVIRKNDSEFLGWCGLKLHDSGDVDLGFRFFKKYWNLGYATESAQACIEYGFSHLNLDSIIGRAMKSNVASIRVLEKIGLKYECDFDFDGFDGVIYRIKK